MAEVSSSSVPRGSRRRGATACGSSSEMLYVLGFIGAVVFFWRQADTGGEHVVAVLKALVWPAFLVYQAFGHLSG